jgi:hypothetical protein
MLSLNVTLETLNKFFDITCNHGPNETLFPLFAIADATKNNVLSAVFAPRNFPPFEHPTTTI